MGAKPYEISLSRNGLNPFEDLLNLIKLIIIMQKLNQIFFRLLHQASNMGIISSFYLLKLPKRVAMIEGLGVIFTKKGKQKPIELK